MHDKTKTFELGGVTYQFRRMTPAVGSYIWQRLMAASYKGLEGREKAIEDAVRQEAERVKAQAEPPKKELPEERLRELCGMTFMFLSFEDLEFIQKNAMRVTSKYEPDEKGRALLPVMSDDGRWTDQALADNPMLVTRLTVEALAYNLASFLA